MDIRRQLQSASGSIVPSEEITKKVSMLPFRKKTINFESPIKDPVRDQFLERLLKQNNSIEAHSTSVTF